MKLRLKKTTLFFLSSVGSFFTQKFKVVQVSLMMTSDLKKVEMMMICRDQLNRTTDVKF